MRTSTDQRTASTSMWPGFALIVGGLLNIVIWPIFTSLHGPGSVNLEGELLGGGALFWGAMMEGPSGLLIALGLAGSRRVLIALGGRVARIGFVLAMIGVVVPAAADLAILAVIPPLLAPVFGVGLILIAVGNRGSSSLTKFSRVMLVGLGMVLLYSFLRFLVVRPELLDRIDGYRIYGLVANVLFGAGWVLFGISLIAGSWRSERRELTVAPAPALRSTRS